MSVVTDHTMVGDHLGGGAFLAAVLGVYAERRSMLVIPATSVVAALHHHSGTDGPTARRLRWLLGADLASVVKVAELDAAAAAETGLGVETRGKGAKNGAEFLLYAPVIWTARRLGLPVLTMTPLAYTPYGLDTRTTP